MAPQSVKPEQGTPAPLRIAHVVGARPQFVKLAPVCRAVAAASATHDSDGMLQNVVIHTGQHYDPAMSDVFFAELALPRPDVQLDVGSGPHGQQTARMLERLEQTLQGQPPDIVLCYGDTNSTLAATLAAAKLHIPTAHVEAGLRSFDRRMPEEVNRIVADHLCDLLFAPTPTAMRNLRDEGLAQRSVLVGDVMLDAVRFTSHLAEQRPNALHRLGVEPGHYLVATVHRADSTDGPALLQLLRALNEIAAAQRPVLLPLHPRTAARLRDVLPDWRPAPALRLMEPLGHLDMISVVQGCCMVLTDSGGVQKEAFFLGRPCITLRDETEWVETVEQGGNLVAGTDTANIVAAVAQWDARLAAGATNFSAGIRPSFGDGNAAAAIVDQSIRLARAARAGRNRATTIHPE